MSPVKSVRASIISTRPGRNLGFFNRVKLVQLLYGPDQLQSKNYEETEFTTVQDSCMQNKLIS